MDGPPPLPVFSPTQGARPAVFDQQAQQGRLAGLLPPFPGSRPHSQHGTPTLTSPTQPLSPFQGVAAGGQPMPATTQALPEPRGVRFSNPIYRPPGQEGTSPEGGNPPVRASERRPSRVDLEGGGEREAALAACACPPQQAGVRPGRWSRRAGATCQQPRRAGPGVGAQAPRPHALPSTPQAPSLAPRRLRSASPRTCSSGCAGRSRWSACPRTSPCCPRRRTCWTAGRTLGCSLARWTARWDGQAGEGAAAAVAVADGTRILRRGIGARLLTRRWR
jgi:hypothetical protein